MSFRREVHGKEVWYFATDVYAESWCIEPIHERSGWVGGYKGYRKGSFLNVLYPKYGPWSWKRIFPCFDRGYAKSTSGYVWVSSEEEAFALAVKFGLNGTTNAADTSSQAFADRVAAEVEVQNLIATL